MSNIAGKSYAMNALTPVPWYVAVRTRALFWVVNKSLDWNIRFVTKALSGLLTLSLIHYARWIVVKPKQFPRLDASQPKEDLKYNYILFHSNFNGSWDQYVDSFSSAIPSGLNLFWYKNVKYPRSVPMLPFHRYITANQIWTNHYYNSTPMAASNDVKSAKRVKSALTSFISETPNASPDEFQRQYDSMLIGLQHDISLMEPTPVVSLSAAEVERRRQAEKPEDTHDE